MSEFKQPDAVDQSHTSATTTRYTETGPNSEHQSNAYRRINSPIPALDGVISLDPTRMPMASGNGNKLASRGI